MKTGALVATLIVASSLMLSALTLGGSQGAVEPQDGAILAAPPDYEGGYGFDALTQTMHDHNGFSYAYLPDGVIKLTLPWGYVTYFSFGMTGYYLGVPEKVSALDYDWSWDAVASERLNDTGVSQGYDYTFTATNTDTLSWTIELRFPCVVGERMKITHTVTNDYPNALTGVEFWYLFDLTHTPEPYVETHFGVYEAPLYVELPDAVTWLRLSNQFQFDWRDADYPNGHAYIGDGSVVGVAEDIAGVSLELGDILSGESRSIDPYFSGVEKTWDATADGLASGPANWDPVGVPDTGDNITFDGTSVYNCNWNVEVTLGDFSMLTGYTGTVTQANNFGIVDWLQQAGTFTGSVSYMINCYGNWTKTGGTFTDRKTKMSMYGDNTIISMNTQFFQNGLAIHANVTIAVITIIDGKANSFLTIASEKTLTISTGKWIKKYLESVSLLGDFTNSGTIAGAGTFYIYVQDADKSIILGAIDCPLIIHIGGSAIASRLTIGADTFLGSTLTIISTTAYTMSLICAGYELTVDGALTIGTRGIITQGTGTVTVGSYLQNGVDSVFNQGATLTIGGDFTVSNGIFNALGDMTAPGNWDTATGNYSNDDNVVTLTGASKTLAMNPLDSFYNVTVSGSYTMNTDTNVRLRATITGTVDGTGDFIEPLPEFTSIGWPYGCPQELYEYTPTQTYWDELAINDAPYWLFLADGVITGVPNDNDTGVHLISLTLTWNDMIVYQNYTIIVCPELLSEADQIMLGVVLSLVMGFGLLGLAIWRNTPLLMVFSGLVFMFSAVAVYKDINLGWTMLSMGLGMVFLYSGGLQFANDSES